MVGRRIEKRTGMIVSVVLTMLGLTAVVADAGVAVVDDEVVFTLHAPGAERVFLVGDFNNWNATVERMPNEGDRFEISLFLVEGTYHYKFVVDGRWMQDPDNPARASAPGSLIVLKERAGGLVLMLEEPTVGGEPASGARAGAVATSARYIGTGDWERDDRSSRQRLDATARFERDRLSGRVVLRSTDDSWRNEPEDVRLHLDRARVAVEVRAFELRGFENDSVWTSAAPVPLIGGEGIYSYNAGFGRRGVTMSTRPDSPLGIRMAYSERSGNYSHGSGVSLGPEEFGGFTGSAGRDTLIYKSGDIEAGADQFALEVFYQSGDIKGGYTRRVDRGLYRGLLAVVQRDSLGMSGDLFESSERHTVSMYWLEHDNIAGFFLSAGYGGGDLNLRRLARGYARWAPASSIVLPDTTEPVDLDDKLMDTRRYLVRTGHRWQRVDLGVDWDRTTFDFEGPTIEASSARVDRLSACLTGRGATWETSLKMEYTNLDYGNTPDEFMVDSPRYNPWLNGRDRYDAAALAAIDEEEYSQVSAQGSWRPADCRHILCPDIIAGGVVWHTTRIFSENYFSEAGLRASWSVGGGVVLTTDGRLASYDKSSWNVADSFAAGYLQLRYDRSWLRIDLGWGFDPEVLDPTVGEYAMIGRSEALRKAVLPGMTRSQSDAVGAALVENERSLRDSQRIRLECVITF